MNNDTGDRHIDGNTLAGPLSTIFVDEVTVAIAVCAGCGQTDQLANAMVYGSPMGLVVRCAECGSILLRFADTPTGRSVDMRGLTVLRFSQPS